MDKELKKEILEFLKKEEQQTVKSLFMTEIDYRATLAIQMSKPKDDKVNAAHLQLGRNKKNLETRLRHIRMIVKELKEDRLIF